MLRMHRARPGTRQFSHSPLVVLPGRFRARNTSKPAVSLPAGLKVSSLQLAVILLLAMLLGRYAGFPPGIPGALVAGSAAAWASRRRPEAELTWVALALACSGWAIGGFASRMGAHSGWAEAGAFVFAVGSTVALLAWPELRSSASRLIGT